MPGWQNFVQNLFVQDPALHVFREMLSPVWRFVARVAGAPANVFALLQETIQEFEDYFVWLRREIARIPSRFVGFFRRQEREVVIPVPERILQAIPEIISEKQELEREMLVQILRLRQILRP